MNREIYTKNTDRVNELKERLRYEVIQEFQQSKFSQNNISTQDSYKNYLQRFTDEENMINSIDIRSKYMNKIYVLNRVKRVQTLHNGYMTVNMVAEYFDVSVETIKTVIKRNFGELKYNGLVVLRGEELKQYKEKFSSEIKSLQNTIPRNHLTLFTKRTVLNIAMLLRDSLVARAIREILLNKTDIETPQGQERFNQYADELQEIRNAQNYIKENINKLVDNLIDDYEPEIIDGKVYIKRCNTIIDMDKKN